MKNFLLMLLDNVLQLVLWGLGLLAFVMMILLGLQHQFGSAAVALVILAICAGGTGYRQGWYGWSRWGGGIPFNFRMMRRSDELPGMSNLPGSNSYVSDVLDETPYRND